jgi:hypothetical protein
MAEVVEGAEKIDIADSLVLGYRPVDTCSCEAVSIFGAWDLSMFCERGRNGDVAWTHPLHGRPLGRL